MEHTNFLLLFLVFTSVLPSLAVPTSRSLKLVEEFSSAQALLSQDDMYTKTVEGRMDMENTDYPGTGANNHHDPGTPGRV